MSKTKEDKPGMLTEDQVSRFRKLAGVSILNEEFEKEEKEESEEEEDEEKVVAEEAPATPKGTKVVRTLSTKSGHKANASGKAQPGTPEQVKKNFSTKSGIQNSPKLLGTSSKADPAICSNPMLKEQFGAPEETEEDPNAGTSESTDSEVGIDNVEDDTGSEGGMDAGMGGMDGGMGGEQSIEDAISGLVNAVQSVAKAAGVQMEVETSGEEEAEVESGSEMPETENTAPTAPPMGGKPPMQGQGGGDMNQLMEGCTPRDQKIIAEVFSKVAKRLNKYVEDSKKTKK